MPSPGHEIGGSRLLHQAFNIFMTSTHDNHAGILDNIRENGAPAIDHIDRKHFCHLPDTMTEARELRPTYERSRNDVCKDATSRQGFQTSPDKHRIKVQSARSDVIVYRCTWWGILCSQAEEWRISDLMICPCVRFNRKAVASGNQFERVCQLLINSILDSQASFQQGVCKYSQVRVDLTTHQLIRQPGDDVCVRQ